MNKNQAQNIPEQEMCRQDPSELAIETSQLTVNYGNVSALFDISLKVPAGRIVGIIGPNGAGKSTFLKTVLGLLKPISGKVSFSGKTLSKMRQKIAYVPQRESVDWDFPITVKDLVLMGRYGKLGLFRRPKQADYEAVQQYLSLVGMDAYSERQISQLSGGQQQRVFLARALIQEAEIYFLDEPFVGIDLTSKHVIMNLLKNLRDKGKTVFVVHHELDNVKTFFDWVILLNIRLVSCGPLEQAFNADTLMAAYGKSYDLFDEVLKISQNKTAGI